MYLSNHLFTSFHQIINLYWLDCLLKVINNLLLFFSLVTNNSIDRHKSICHNSLLNGRNCQYRNFCYFGELLDYLRKFIALNLQNVPFARVYPSENINFLQMTVLAKVVFSKISLIKVILSSLSNNEVLTALPLHISHDIFFLFHKNYQ